MIGSYDMAKVVLRKKSLNNVEGGHEDRIVLTEWDKYLKLIVSEGQG
jgi:hypothetical protein